MKNANENANERGPPENESVPPCPVFLWYSVCVNIMQFLLGQGATSVKGVAPHYIFKERRESMAISPGRPRRFETPEDMAAAWEAYKKKCDNQKVVTHHFVAKKGDFLSKKLRRAITYTIEGFCADARLARQDFYENYASKDEYSDIVTLIREECEVDARSKFELEIIPAQLAPLPPEPPVPGSPPLVRGTDRRYDPRNRDGRITPACAGNRSA
jgi:hypothetical protein